MTPLTSRSNRLRRAFGPSFECRLMNPWTRVVWPYSSATHASMALRSREEASATPSLRSFEGGLAGPDAVEPGATGVAVGSGSGAFDSVAVRSAQRQGWADITGLLAHLFGEVEPRKPRTCGLALERQLVGGHRRKVLDDDLGAGHELNAGTALAAVALHPTTVLCSLTRLAGPSHPRLGGAEVLPRLVGVTDRAVAGGGRVLCRPRLPHVLRRRQAATAWSGS